MKSLLTLLLLLSLAAPAAAAQEFVVTGRFEYEDKAWDQDGWTGEDPLRPVRRADVVVTDDEIDEPLYAGDLWATWTEEYLPALLETIGPDFAALLSIVPETFSFTLSELQLMRIPVIATRVGSFPSRIEHGRTGWLIEPDAASLVAKVRELYENQAQISAVRSRLQQVEQGGPGQMVET